MVRIISNYRVSVEMLLGKSRGNAIESKKCVHSYTGGGTEGPAKITINCSADDLCDVASSPGREFYNLPCDSPSCLIARNERCNCGK